MRGLTPRYREDHAETKGGAAEAGSALLAVCAAEAMVEGTGKNDSLGCLHDAVGGFKTCLSGWISTRKVIIGGKGMGWMTRLRWLSRAG